MKVVPLVSGGLDSTVMSVLIREEGFEQYPLFVNYGQINLERERSACLRNFAALGLPLPEEVTVPGYGAFLPSGLTDSNKRIVEDAFLPGRNMLFLLLGAAHAQQVGASSVAIGFLDESLSLFPDQTRRFADDAGHLLSQIMRAPVQILTPLIRLDKSEVLAVARSKGISGTYSCHAGTETPCGSCIACREYTGLEV